MQRLFTSLIAFVFIFIAGLGSGVASANSRKACLYPEFHCPTVMAGLRPNPCHRDTTGKHIECKAPALTAKHSMPKHSMPKHSIPKHSMPNHA